MTTLLDPRSLVLAGAFALAAGAAQAGECPADKVGMNLIDEGPNQPVGVTDAVLGALHLGEEPVMIEGRTFRMRRLEIRPGGIVPFHAHADRPALIYVVSGTIIEHSADCAVPIVHTAGDVSVESHVVSHWWENTGEETVVLISADLLHDEADEHMM
jgi:quercetin dioxygenase-like cupin family protein